MNRGHPQGNQRFSPAQGNSGGGGGGNRFQQQQNGGFRPGNNFNNNGNFQQGGPRPNFQQGGQRPNFSGGNQSRQPNPDPPTEVRKEAGVCSLFVIDTTPGSKAYRYDVDIVNTLNQKSLTKAADDGQRALNRRLCYEILVSGHFKTEGFGMEEGGEIVYDNKATMFSSTPLQMPKSQVMVESEELPEFVTRYCKDASFMIHVLPSSTNHVLDLTDISQYTSQKSRHDEDRSLRTFLELATSQHPINSDTYTSLGSKLVENDDQGNERVGNYVVLRPCVVKGVRVIQNMGNPTPAVVLDSKICPFFEAQNLLETVTALCQGRLPSTASDLSAKCLKTLQDVRVEVSYAPHRSFGIGRFSDKPMNQMMASYNGTKVPMPVFFQQKYGINLRHPQLPGVIPNTPRPNDKVLEVFPIEELLIMPGQVVPLEKMSKPLSDKLLRSNSIFPQDRLNKIMQHAININLFDPENAVLRAFGLRVQRTSNGVEIRVRPCPRIQFKDQTVNVNPERAEWARDASNNAYIDASELKDWLMLCSQEHEKVVRDFIHKFIKLAQRKTMRYSTPILRTFTRGQWIPVFEQCVDKKMNFVMLVDAKDNDSHGQLKYMEAKHKVLTQQVTLEKVVDVVQLNKNQILENILNKTNCKNFGLNYVPVMEQCAQPFDLDRGEVLVIGYDVAHPSGVSAQERRMLRVAGVQADSLDPSVVGICANMAKHPYSFVGDYFYQESRREAVDTLQLAERTQWILEQLQRNRPSSQKPPKHVFVLRDGLSEGQLKMALYDELAAIKQGCLNHSADYKPQFTFVIGTKRHFKKFFAVRNNRVENLAPGSVISEKVVREDCPEFFMQSHYPLKGVGKAVEYSVPVNEIGLTDDQLQAFLNALCYDHQIVNSAISLPEPIYQADELAKRGQNNYLAMKKIEPNAIPRFPTRLVNYRALTEKLSYQGSHLSATRFSA